MTHIIGVIGAAVLFGLFTALRPRDRSCSGGCIGCTRAGACESRELAALRERARDLEHLGSLE